MYVLLFLSHIKEERKSIYIASFILHIVSNTLRHGSQSFTCKLYHAYLSFVSVHQMVKPYLRQQTSNCSLLLIYLPRRNERLSLSGWLTYSRCFTNISGHPSATGQAQDTESSLAKDRRSTVVPQSQLCTGIDGN